MTEVLSIQNRIAKEKASYPEKVPCNFWIKITSGGNRTRDLALTRQCCRFCSPFLLKNRRVGIQFFHPFGNLVIYLFHNTISCLEHF
jgi:hypothetical protein